MRPKKIIGLALSIFIFIFMCKRSDAQYLPYNSYSSAEVTIGGKGGEILPSAAFNNFSRGQFKVGLAFRLNAFFANNKRYITALAILTSGKTGPSVFFADQIPENIDTIIFEKSRNGSLNVAILFEYSFTQNWAAGFDIDFLGISLGPKVNGQFQDNNQERVVATPHRLNLLLLSDNDKGSLNSELYAKYFMDTEPYYFKAGATFYFNENQTLKNWRLDNDRWRYKTLAPMIGASYLLNTSVF